MEKKLQVHNLRISFRTASGKVQAVRNISFDLPKAGAAKVEIYNVKGQLVRTLFDDVAPFGRTSLVWNGQDNNGSTVGSGVYFYRLNANGHSESRKMMLLK